MMTYLALLRGINVGEHRVTMELVRALFRDMGVANVRSYIQSGNVFFETENDPRVLTARIEAHLRAVLGYNVPVFLRTAEALEAALTSNPFSNIEVTPDTRLCVLFIKEPTSCNESLPVSSDDGTVEITRVTATEVYFMYRLVSGRPPDTSRFLTQTLGESAETGTTRFYGTLLKMLEFGRGSR